MDEPVHFIPPSIASSLGFGACGVRRKDMVQWTFGQMRNPVNALLAAPYAFPVLGQFLFGGRVGWAGIRALRAADTGTGGTGGAQKVGSLARLQLARTTQRKQVEEFVGELNKLLPEPFSKLHLGSHANARAVGEDLFVGKYRGYILNIAAHESPDHLYLQVIAPGSTAAEGIGFPLVTESGPPMDLLAGGCLRWIDRNFPKIVP
jgi:hypothetical protein